MVDDYVPSHFKYECRYLYFAYYFTEYLKYPRMIVSWFNLTESQINNLLSGLIGAVLAVLLTPFIDRIKTAIRLNSTRKTLVTYLEYVGMDKTFTYIEDMEYISRLVKLDPEAQHASDFPHRTVDAMPMLTIDIYKSYPPDDIRKVCYLAKNYVLMIDIFYSIEFLKSSMPLLMYNTFLSQVKKHFEEEGVKGGAEEIKHYRECGIIRSFEDSAIAEGSPKIVRAKKLYLEMDEIVTFLKGNRLYWFWKYLLNQ